MTSAKVELWGAWRRRNAAPAVRDFLAGLPAGRYGSKALHDAYSAHVQDREPMGVANWGRLMAEIGVPKVRMTAGIFYILENGRHDHATHPLAVPDPAPAPAR